MYKQGDILFMDFGPTKGHEQSGRRPSVVISNNDYNRLMELYIVCPITNNIKSFPTHVLLPQGFPITGAVLCEHIRTVDLSKRNAQKKEECPPDILNEILEIIKSFY